MAVTAEIRWFARGSIPHGVFSWFQEATESSNPPESRVDDYLLMPEITSLGIKVRLGRLEIKIRKRKYGEIDLGRGISGRLEQWQKWSLALESVEQLFKPGDSWIPVAKRRYLRKYEVAGDIEVRPLALERFAESGCGVELTAIEVLGNKWWTMAFESWGDEVSLTRNLIQTSEYLSKSEGAPTLLTAESYGYPRWLAKSVT
jgi:hypothetical protein